MKRIAVLVAAVCLGLAGCSGSTGGSGAGTSAQQAEYQQNLDRGFGMLRDKRYSEAKDLFSGMARSNPDDPAVALALGVAHHELGEWDAAEAQYQKAERNGAETRVGETIEKGESKQASTTIAKLATANLEKLSQDRPK